MNDGERIAGFLMQGQCDFPEVFAETAPVEDPLDFREYPAAEIGYVRADYSGYRWYGQYFPCRNELRTDEFNRESQELYAGIVTRFGDLKMLREFCLPHPEAKTGTDEYGFYVNGKAADYQVKLIIREKDYNLYLHGFSKTPRQEGLEKKEKGDME